MTTMFVQLRRVVYLLVLLQCYACVTRAQSGEARVNKSPDERLREKEVQLKYEVDRVNDTVVKGVSCLNLWKEAVRESNQSRADADSAAGRAEDISQRISEMITGVGAEGTINNWKEVKGLVAEVEETTGKLRQSIEETERKLRDAYKTGKVFCRFEYENAINAKEELERARGRYDEALDPYEGPKPSGEKNKELYENSTVVHNEISAFIGDYKLFGGDAQHSQVTSYAHMKDAREVLDATVVKLGLLKTKVDAQVGKIGSPPENTEATAVKQKIEDVYEKVKNSGVKDTVRAKIEDEPKESKLEASNFSVKLKSEMENVVQRLEEERRRIAEEKVRREEDARRAAEEEAKRKRAEEEERAREEAAQKAREREAREAAKKAKEVEARLAETAEKSREKEVREAAEKAKGEAERAQKAKKKNDRAESPALVHASMLLLVLICVLGCTLVC
ncbi:uncharacterized protein TM35_000781000 [Trypanosoma theileri]|uniref:Uncharacterized protein n=1 Tax=Trypanosoma theileri TaxID=67003 RepID=A0A1X0NEY0_9TRYP|nr:uncharacterized protein TM35_000781000 [Trypanosoma theileri]ORC83132.1 hypothetical protein TM35_000781000 [Trypanosoma theileri]